MNPPGDRSQNAFHADAPIRQASQDLLNRVSFSRSLAHAVAAWHGDESLVVGLSGEWGSGKTSIKNLVVQELRKFQEGPNILELNPWQWAAQDLLTPAFFEEIARALGQTDKSRTGRRLAAKFRYYSSFLQMSSHVTGGLINSLVIPLTLASIAGISAYEFFKSFATNLTALSGALLTLTLVLSWGGSFARKLSEVVTARVQLLELPLEDRKETLRGLLKRSKKSLLVVIDDLDRLTPAEVRLVLQLVKANLDFPKLVFFLLYDRQIIERFLENEGFPGRDYLEKIVQAPFDVPTISKSQVHRVLFAGVDGVLSRLGSQVSFDQVRWGNLFYGPLAPYFNDLRSVYRFLATLDFHVQLFKGRSALEVNALDLVAVEAVRVFEPAVYQRLRSAKGSITGVESMSMHSKSDASKRVADSIIEAAPAERREDMKSLLKLLFPRLESIYGNLYHAQESVEQWRQDARVCCPDKFDRYFQLSMPVEELSESDIADLISATANYDAFVETAKRFIEVDLCTSMFEALDSYKQKIPLASAPEFLPALIDLADYLPEGRGELMTAGVRTMRVAYWYLKQSDDPHARGKLLIDAFKRAHGLSLVATLLMNDDTAETKKETESLLIDKVSRESIRDLWLQMIRQMANDPMKLLQLSSAAFVLYRWEAWGKPNEVKEWFETAVTSPNLALQLIVATNARGSIHSAGDRVARVVWRINLDALEKLAAPEKLEKLLENVDPKGLSEVESRALESFRAAMSRRSEGKKGDPLLDE